MANRSVTKLNLTDGAAMFYLFDGVPEVQVGRIAQFLVWQTVTGEKPTVSGWRRFVELTRDNGRATVAAQEIDGIPGDLDHLFVIDTTTGDFSFAHHRRDRNPLGAGWAAGAEADSISDVAADAVRYADQLSRRAERISLPEAARARVADWARTVRQIEHIYTVANEPRPFTLPDPAELPNRSAEQDDAEFANAVLRHCNSSADWLLSSAREADRIGMPDVAEEARRAARGWLLTGYRNWLAAI